MVENVSFRPYTPQHHAIIVRFVRQNRQTPENLIRSGFEVVSFINWQKTVILVLVNNPNNLYETFQQQVDDFKFVGPRIAEMAPRSQERPRDIDFSAAPLQRRVIRVWARWVAKHR